MAVFENEFVCIFFSLLYENGITHYNETELEKKLYYYSQKEEYRELFQNLFPFPGFSTGDPMLNIQNGIHYYKDSVLRGECDFISEGEIFLRRFSSPHLSSFQKHFTEDGIQKMYDMARDFGVQYKLECMSKTPFHIYAKNPNDQYHLCHGNWLNDDYSWELVTDGEISHMEMDTVIDNFSYYENPTISSLELQLQNVTSVFAEIRDASYAVLQGLENDNIKRSKVYTSLTDFEKLMQIVNIHSNYCTNLTEEKPFVRKYILR